MMLSSSLKISFSFTKLSLSVAEYALSSKSEDEVKFKGWLNGLSCLAQQLDATENGEYLQKQKRN